MAYGGLPLTNATVCCRRKEAFRLWLGAYVECRSIQQEPLRGVVACNLRRLILALQFFSPIINHTPYAASTLSTTKICPGLGIFMLLFCHQVIGIFPLGLGSTCLDSNFPLANQITS